MRPIGWLD